MNNKNKPVPARCLTIPEVAATLKITVDELREVFAHVKATGAAGVFNIGPAVYRIAKSNNFPGISLFTSPDGSEIFFEEIIFGTIGRYTETKK